LTFPPEVDSALYILLDVLGKVAKCVPQMVLYDLLTGWRRGR